MWLVYDGTKAIYNYWLSTAQTFEAEIAVVITAKNITKPLYQDYTREGRLIGFVIRLGRIAAGIIIQLAIAAAFLLVAVVWVALPFYIFYQIFRNLIPNV